MGVRTKYVAVRILPDADNEYGPGAVVVEGDRIAWVGPASTAPEVETTVDLGDAVLTPGLVNAHTHLDLSHLKGRVPFEGAFADWLDAVRVGRKEVEISAAALWSVKEAVSRGTTAFGDIVSPRSFDEMVAVLAEAGVRARLFVEALGSDPARADEIFEEVWNLVEMKALPDAVETGVSPHAPYSVSRELFARAVAVADGHDRPLAVHVAETLEELAFIRHGIGPLRELRERLGVDHEGYEPFGDLPGLLALFDMQQAPLLLVHCNYMRPRDVPAGAFVVYCPTAHQFFGHPEHPVLELLEEGVRVVLGSDSAASGETVDVLSETQHLARTRPDLQPRAIFRMATEWGARALGLDAGALARGRLADLAAFTPPKGHEVLGDPDARSVLTVVGGRILHRGQIEPQGDGVA